MEGGVVVPATMPRSNDHIPKRALRNKSLSVSFDEKDLKDFVGGFQKRKKKRRKEAEKKQGEAERRKRLEVRKQRRKEKEDALYGGAPPGNDVEAIDEDSEQDDESELNPSVSCTTTYENGDVMVTVTTSELTREEEELPITKSAPLSAVSIGGGAKQHKVPVSKKKPFKKPRKGSSRPKLQNKRERRKGNKKK